MPKPAKRPTFVVFLQRKNVPGMQPLFGPASLTMDDAETRLAEAMESGHFTKGEIRETR